MIPSKLNRLDRGARFISTLRQGQAAAGCERGHRRSVSKLPGFGMLGCREIPAGLSQDFVKRYQWLSESLRHSAFSMDRLTERFIFYPPARDGCAKDFNWKGD